jgi:hypothetical protein
MAMSDQRVRIRKEVAVAYLKVVFRHLHQQTYETTKDLSHNRALFLPTQDYTHVKRRENSPTIIINPTCFSGSRIYVSYTVIGKVAGGGGGTHMHVKMCNFW